MEEKYVGLNVCGRKVIEDEESKEEPTEFG
jgi:hypothetical protein